MPTPNEVIGAIVGVWIVAVLAMIVWVVIDNMREGKQ